MKMDSSLMLYNQIDQLFRVGVISEFLRNSLIKAAGLDWIDHLHEE